MVVEQNKLSVHAVIFDMDGTLIDSIDIYFKIVEIALERLKLPQVSRKRILDAAEDRDFSWELVLPGEVHHKKDEIIAAAWEIIDEIAPQMFAENLKLIRGADHILQSISTSIPRIGLVTSTQRRDLKIKMQPLKSAGVEKLFEVIITSDDVQKRKPAPDPLIACAQKLHVDSGKCVYIGDTRTDIKAGKAAGMKTVGVLTGFDDYDMLAKEGPDVIIDSIRNLTEVLEI
ncbi:MAG: HAD family hydrolase [Desulfobacterales bacterium]|jgi:HAD superfamily hydrolase (TIGR01509 family)